MKTKSVPYFLIRLLAHLPSRGDHKKDYQISSDSANFTITITYHASHNNYRIVVGGKNDYWGYSHSEFAPTFILATRMVLRLMQRIRTDCALNDLKEAIAVARAVREGSPLLIIEKNEGNGDGLRI